MYCHGCHHQWQREGEGIECPACRSSSTEIVSESSPLDDTSSDLTGMQISSDDDPRHFHARQSQQDESATSGSSPADPSTPAPLPVYGPERPPASAQASPSPGRATDPTPHGNTPHGPTTTHQFIFVPSVTFFTTTVSDNAPQQGQPTATPSAADQPPHGTLPVTWFGMHFFTPHFHAPPPPPPSGTNSPPTGSTAGVTPDQPRPQQDAPQPEQHHQGPQMAPGMPGGFMAAVIASLFNPAGPMMFGGGDAVYSQEAFDRIITQLREANANVGGAPPASQSAIDKLQTKEVDDQMLGVCDGKPKCVICVDEMVKGDKASILPCNHFFHGECVTPWLKQHNTCPVCRRSIEEEAHGKPAKTVDEMQPHQAHEHERHENTSNSTDCM